MIVGPLNSGVAVGGAGVSTVSTTSAARVRGKVLAVYLEYLDTPPATTDVTVVTAGSAHPAVTILSVTDAATSGWFYPRVGAQSISGAALLFAAGGTAVPAEIPIDDKVTVTIAQANVGDGVNVYLMME